MREHVLLIRVWFSLFCFKVLTISLHRASCVLAAVQLWPRQNPPKKVKVSTRWLRYAFNVENVLENKNKETIYGFLKITTAMWSEKAKVVR
uniref:Uncharacterized protein n=1 Tax=Daphnia magna TaxID=35525 RepID=A0A0N8EPP6_9CRUS